MKRMLKVVEELYKKGREIWNRTKRRKREKKKEKGEEKEATGL